MKSKRSNKQSDVNTAAISSITACILVAEKHVMRYQQVKKQDAGALAQDALKEKDWRMRNAEHRRQLERQIEHFEKREVHDDTNMTEKEREINLALITRAKEVVQTPQILPLRPCKDEIK